MNPIIVESPKPLVLVGGGAGSAQDLQEIRHFSDTFVAADGGAELCLAAGIMPNATIGDLDSLSAETRARLPSERVHCIEEQNSTDFDKALRSIHAPLVIGVGFLGKRIDHQLAALNRLVARATMSIILLDGEDIVFHCPPALSLDLRAGARVSLFPMAPTQGRSTGLKWPIDGIGMAPAARVGTSNEATGPVSLAMDAPGMLVILPRALLSLAVRQLQRAAPWPAPEQ
ncbi:thiamine diphosphokinase [Primorskyibacter sp. S187A]|uniref:thiamine diphosphokinase n=1 Tax=Primorskyibacter sp. S187A TaxID=3415130 RepID=UPI003C7B4B38